MITNYMIIFMWAFSQAQILTPYTALSQKRSKVSYGMQKQRHNRNSTRCCRTIEISSPADESNYYHNHGTFTNCLYLHNYTYLLLNAYLMGFLPNENIFQDH